VTTSKSINNSLRKSRNLAGKIPVTTTWDFDTKLQRTSWTKCFVDTINDR